MNLRTTLVLLVLVATGGVLFLLGPNLPAWIGLARPDGAGAGTLAALESDLTAADLTAISVERGERQVVLERNQAGEWSLPGGWPTRQPEVKELVERLTGLRSRFAPIPVQEGTDLKAYGLEPPALIVTARTSRTNHRLAFGEGTETDDGNRFSRPTYLRLDDKPEIIRVAPGLVAALDRPAEHYQQRRLFPFERVAKEAGSPDKVERLAATALSLADKKTPAAGYSLTRTGDDWELREPVRDNVDPEKLKTVLTALPDVWAEQFVGKPAKDLADYGLKEPEQTIRITRPGGTMLTLLIGKPSQTKTRTVTKPAPPFGPPMPPQREIIHDEYRYAKLADNDQVFEIKADKLKDVFAPLNDLRDARLARFRTEDARRVELAHGDQTLVFAKDKDGWRVEKPFAAPAEDAKVNELLDKLSGLSAREADVLDKSDPKAFGFEPKPAGTVKVSVEEEVKGEGDTKTKKNKSFTFTLGKHDEATKKLYVRVNDLPRINAIEDSLAALVKRPALAYRGKRLFDPSPGELTKIELQRGDGKVTLEQVNNAWKLTAPVQAEVDAPKVSQLASSLRNLEAVEYVSNAPKPDDLAKEYDLAKPAVAAILTFTKDGKPLSRTLHLGKARAEGQEYFARLADGDAVFVLKKDVRDSLDQNSLALLPQQLWQMNPDDLAAVRVQKEGQDEYRLGRKDADWQITGPFEARAVADLAQTLSSELANLRAERYEAHAAKDPAAYGLDKPYLRLTLIPAAKDKDAAKDRVVLVGKPTDKDAKTRFAKVADADAVFVVSDKLIAAVDKGPLDLLDRKLLSLDPKTIEKISAAGPGGTLALQREGEAWRVTESPAGPYPADKDIAAGLTTMWSPLVAQRVAAYGPKADPARYGLDKPERTVTLTVQPPATEGKKPEPVKHVLALGAPVQGTTGERYARLDSGPGVVVLGTTAVTELTRGHLDFVDRTVLKFEPGGVAALQRRAGMDELELAKRDKGWQVVKPMDVSADEPTLQTLLEDLARARAVKTAAYPVKELKPYELDTPAAVVTVRMAGAEGKAVQHVLKVGKVADPMTGDRFAVAEGGTAVAVLPAALANRLLAAPLAFRNRNLAELSGVDRVTLERGPRKATFALAEGNWKMTEPLAAEAEQAGLKDFVRELERLRANEFVAEKPDDLKAFGLDKPEARWRLEAGGKEVLLLLVGTAHKDGQRRYAKLAAGDLVFLLDPVTTTRVLAEYRSRSPWPTPPDAAQVEALRYGSPKEALSLEKSDNTWKALGKPGAAVKPEAVSDLLAALGGLRAERYVEDKAKDLKVYGLEPPELVIEVRTPSGKWELHVGRREGDSKRYYARVADKDRSEVLVVGEAEAARLVRPPASLLLEGSGAGTGR